MATLTVPYSFNTNTAIVASEMNSNFAAVKTFTEGISTGVNIDSGAIDSTKLATNTIQLLTPTGSIVQYGGNAAPTGWMLCNGGLISRTTYAALFAVIGTTYGAGDGSTTFALPNFQGRVPVGVKGTAGEPFLSNGETGGSRTSTAPHTHGMKNHTHGMKNHTHSGTTGDDAPDHSHLQRSGASLNVSLGANTGLAFNHSPGSPALDSNMYTAGATVRHQHPITVGAPNDNTTNTPNDNTSDDSSVSAANGNLQPYLTVNFIIKL